MYKEYEIMTKMIWLPLPPDIFKFNEDSVDEKKLGPAGIVGAFYMRKAKFKRFYWGEKLI